MQQTTEPNKTLLVDGPASVKLVSGKAEVFGYQIKESLRVVVREGKRLPFFVLEKAVFDLSLGANASVQEVDGCTIPLSWSKPVEAVLALQQKPSIVLVIGTIDSGKSSLCTYIVNRLVNGKCKIAVLDGDVGQSDIGPSTTVGYALTSKRVTDLYDLKLSNAFFVGDTSAALMMPKAIEGLAAMQAELLLKQPDYVLINTDGFVGDENGVNYKMHLVNELKPDLIVCVQVTDELAPLIGNIHKTPLIVVEPSSALSQRDAEKRRTLREMTYARYLKNAKLQIYPLSQITVEPRSALPKDQEPEKGLLVGLWGRGSKFLGIGVLREINSTRKALKVQTSVSAKPIRLVLGKVQLDMKLREI